MDFSQASNIIDPGGICDGMVRLAGAIFFKMYTITVIHQSVCENMLGLTILAPTCPIIKKFIFKGLGFKTKGHIQIDTFLSILQAQQTNFPKLLGKH